MMDIFSKVYVYVKWIVVVVNIIVFIIGESGIGKELFVWYIYWEFLRWEGLFFLINCVVFSDELLEF